MTLATRQRGERRSSRRPEPGLNGHSSIVAAKAVDAKRIPGAITLPTLALYDGAPVTYAGGRLMVDGAVVRVRDGR